MRVVVHTALALLVMVGSGFSGKEKEVPKVSVAFRFESAFGGKGSGLGRLHEASGIALDPVGTVYVADTGNNRVQKFDADGEYLAEVGDFGWDPGQFNQPSGVAIGRSGREVYVADSQNNRIQLFSPPERR